MAIPETRTVIRPGAAEPVSLSYLGDGSDGVTTFIQYGFDTVDSVTLSGELSLCPPNTITEVELGTVVAGASFFEYSQHGEVFSCHYDSSVPKSMECNDFFTEGLKGGTSTLARFFVEASTAVYVVIPSSERWVKGIIRDALSFLFSQRRQWDLVRVSWLWNVLSFEIYAYRMSPSASLPSSTSAPLAGVGPGKKNNVVILLCALLQ
jgi:hypothetical protein